MYSAGVQQLDRAAAERGRHLVAAAAAAAAALASAEQQSAAAAGSARLPNQAGPQLSEHYFPSTSSGDDEPAGPTEPAAGAQDAQAEALHQYYTSHAHHAHHAHHHHHYRLSSDSSLSSGSQFGGPASSAAHLHELHHELQHHQHHLHSGQPSHLMRNLAGHHHHLHHQPSAAKFRAQTLGRHLPGALWDSLCSRKCVFVTCFLVIVFIFILVIGLSAYLNFLINLNKINLSPLSGRLRVEQPGDSYSDQLANRTSKEFLAKQQQYETILRGALDRTQALLKSYPNHLVKSEVYSFRNQPTATNAASLWVYFRLFINKRTLAQDSQLMKRKSLDEHLEKQFLPRLTQQTLQSGFEKLIQMAADGRPRIQARSAVQQAARSAVAVAVNQVRSFDEQISRLMPIIESIDLQSIQVSAEFDMLQSASAISTENQAMSDNLRASQFLTTPSSSGSGGAPAGSIMVATGAPEPSSTARPVLGNLLSSSADELSVSTRKFTLTGYKENSTRPGIDRSAFLTSHQHRKAQTNATGSQPVLQASPAQARSAQADQPSAGLVKLVSGQPVVSQNGHLFSQAPKQADLDLSSDKQRQVENSTPFVASPSSSDKLDKPDKQPGNSSLSSTNQNNTFAQAESTSQKSPPALQMLAPYLKAGDFSSPASPLSSTLAYEASTSSSSSRNSPQTPPKRKADQLGEPSTPASVQDLWASALSGRKNVTILKLDRAQAGSNQTSSSRATRIMVSSTTSSPLQVQAHQQKANQTGVDERAQDWQKISLLSSDITDTIRAQLGQSVDGSGALGTGKPKVSPHLHQGGSLISVAPATQAHSEQAGQSAILLNRELQAGRAAEGQPGSSTTAATPTMTTAMPARPQPQRKPGAANSRQRQVLIKPTISSPTKQPQQFQKLKKPAPAEQKLSAESAGSSAPRGIKIVDNFLASVNGSASDAAGRQASSVVARNASALDQLAATLPTTIELTRSTTTGVNPVSQPTVFAVTQAPSSRPGATGTPAPASSTSTTDTPGRLRAVSSSNQWRPIASPSSSSRRPNLTLIVSSGGLDAQRPLPGARGQGSQSPFAMPAGVFANQQQARPGASRTPATSSHEFESHRMSRMRHQASPAEPDVRSPATQATSTLLVDDFIVTTSTTSEPRASPSLDRQPARAADPSGGQQRDPLATDTQLRQTRGPFAFETLKEPLAQLTTTTSSSRLERSSEPTDDKLLGRNRLDLAGSPRARDESEDSAAGDGALKPAASFGNRKAAPLMTPESRQAGPPTPADQLELQVARLEQARQTGDSSNASSSWPHPLPIEGNDYSLRCQYYGCKAKGSLKFTCLNQTQICDDFIDCQDESDELDCVSLLKQDAKSRQLSFSNGEGIIYLNRKGSLAPMCIDYFLDSSALGDFDSSNDVRKQQELIKQINTIGQYACSLQSFSRLVSVKINHHQSVDSSNLIRSSRHYHRLSIIESGETTTVSSAALPPTSGVRDKSLDGSFGSYKASGLLGQHEVEVSTTPDCPSQRTVFVKCGAFECGQDSFSVSAGLAGQSSADQSAAKRKGGVIINDFPWLVKLYYMGSLACHGYLIDELWLISSSECFMSNMSKLLAPSQAQPFSLAASANSWTAEISYEHYGNHDYQTIESNRRSIKDILVYPNTDTAESSSLNAKLEHQLAQALLPIPDPSIVLAKLEKPVRFSPLNRPICLPLTTSPSSAARSPPNEAFSEQYKECVTATLPNASLPVYLMPPTQELQLNKVKVQGTNDCLGDGDGAGKLRFNLDDLICVSGAAQDSSSSPGEQELTSRGARIDADQLVSANADATHVLICSTIPSARSRSRWTIVGVQNKATGLRVRPNKLLFTAISSLTDWIIDTMNPNPRQRVASVPTNSPPAGGGVGGVGLSNNDISNGAILNGEFVVGELNPMRNRSTLLTEPDGSQSCIQFKCSSGECLSWSRICDGLYDCSSHDDEKDCHK